MKCVKCGHASTSVVDSRPDKAEAIRRRRRCDGCGARFNTWEVAVNVLALVEQRRAALRRFKARMTPGQRAEFNKRNSLRRAAREQAAATGQPVAELYAAWGVE
ncbi:MAG: hypothetical protein ABFD65_13885 [Candidatus Polarisedimenticolia bacterium]